jgi:hypothetical protein
MSDLFSATLPRRRADRPEHPAGALSVPWQQIWPGASRQGAELPAYLRVRVPASKGACCALSLSTCPPTRPSRELQPKQKANRGRIPSLGPAGPSAPVIVSVRHQKAAAALNPAEQNFWQIDHFGKCLTCSAPPCLDGAQTDQSTRLELSRCLGNKSGLVHLVRAPNCRLTSVFESPRPKGRVALFRSPPAPHQAKSRTTAETKGQPWQDPVAGSRGAKRPRNCQCAPPEGGCSLEPS